MRWHLLKTFDEINVIDLHGSTKKRETAPDGSPDDNVFDIQQGVAIVVAIKRPSSAAKLAELRHYDLWGQRAAKYEWLWENRTSNVLWVRPELRTPTYAFVPRDWTLREPYDQGFNVREFFQESSTGVQTGNDAFLVAEGRQELIQRIRSAAPRLSAENLVLPIDYRPFDDRFAVYAPDAAAVRKGGLELPASYRSRHAVMQHMTRANVALLVPRRLAIDSFQHVFVTTKIPEMCVISNLTREQNVTLPLYLYPSDGELDQSRRVNFEPKLYAKLRALATHPERGDPDAVAVFHYIYGALHCPAYRETYAEFLKIYFPRIPWPPSPDVFWDVSGKGGELRRLHLMEAAAIGDTPYPFTGEGAGLVEKPEFRDGAVWINKTQRFENAPEISWGFHIGGYQPAQKWLKDRKGRTLDYEDVQHYQRILKILTETDRIMKTIEMPLG